MLNCPYSQHIVAKECHTWMCASCGWNPKVNEERLKRVRKRDFSIRYEPTMTAIGTYYMETLRFLKVDIPKEPKVLKNYDETTNDDLMKTVDMILGG